MAGDATMGKTDSFCTEVVVSPDFRRCVWCAVVREYGGDRTMVRGH